MAEVEITAKRRSGLCLLSLDLAHNLPAPGGLFSLLPEACDSST